MQGATEPGSRWHTVAFWLASAEAFLVALILFYKTKMVDHPEFVSFPKVVAASIIWLALMVVAFWCTKAKPARFWVVLTATSILVLPAAIQIAVFLLRKFSFIH